MPSATWRQTGISGSMMGRRDSEEDHRRLLAAEMAELGFVHGQDVTGPRTGYGRI